MSSKKGPRPSKPPGAIPRQQAKAKKAPKHKPPASEHTFEMLITGLGVFPYQSRNQKEIIEAFEAETDRAVAVVSGSMIESRLEAALAARFLYDEVILERMFRNSGPLGSFAAKIDLAYAIGILSKAAHRDAVRLKDVRNLFAHNLEIRDFATQSIKAQVANLELINSHVVEREVPEGSFIASMHPGDIPLVSTINFSARRLVPRDRWLITVSIFLTALVTCEINRQGVLL